MRMKRSHGLDEFVFSGSLDSYFSERFGEEQKTKLQELFPPVSSSWWISKYFEAAQACETDFSFLVKDAFIVLSSEAALNAEPWVLQLCNIDIYIYRYSIIEATLALHQFLSFHGILTS